MDIITQRYIEEYLNPNKNWPRSIPIKHRYEILTQSNVDNNAIYETIHNIEDYNDFLRTPYWKGISEYLKESSGKCSKCGGTSKLQVHHETYQFHGLEHTVDGQRCLSVLCRKCHMEAHNKLVQTVIDEKTTSLINKQTLLNFLCSHMIDNKHICLLDDDEIASKININKSEVKTILKELKLEGCIFMKNLKNFQIRFISPTKAGLELSKKNFSNEVLK